MSIGVDAKKKKYIKLWTNTKPSIKCPVINECPKYFASFLNRLFFCLVRSHSYYFGVKCIETYFPGKPTNSMQSWCIEYFELQFYYEIYKISTYGWRERRLPILYMMGTHSEANTKILKIYDCVNFSFLFVIFLLLSSFLNSEIQVFRRKWSASDLDSINYSKLLSIRSAFYTLDPINVDFCKITAFFSGIDYQR